MDIYKNERLLIISNNVLSTTKNNGKTIYSYINSLPTNCVAQLYFSSETPAIKGYSYYQLSDKDIVKGMFFPEKRGRCVAVLESQKRSSSQVSFKYRGDFFRIAREGLWYKKWKSTQLLEWLDEINPTVVFFVAGDSCFAYDIFRYVVKRYTARAALYITDDYIMPRRKEQLIGKIRRILIKKKIVQSLSVTDAFFTISRIMREEYRRILGRDSYTIVNLTEALKLDIQCKKEDNIVLLYAGSLYYGRDAILGKIAAAIKKYNDGAGDSKALLKVYTNTEPDNSAKEKFVVEGACEYCGSLSKDELQVALNKASILVFVESFDEDQKEKTKCSLSTKVPEYLSVGKPILAVGPKDIGSIEYLADVACCAFCVTELQDKLVHLLNNRSEWELMAQNALKKYELFHDREKTQAEFLKILFEKSNY